MVAYIYPMAVSMVRMEKVDSKWFGRADHSGTETIPGLFLRSVYSNYFEMGNEFDGWGPLLADLHGFP